ncbi:5-methylcytosine-specific restriction enzyme [Lentibacillus sp. JNUCC-1]|uniref:AAA family ATPase n=1 Tax=Lentibacillus sp. JNUCC-1 TaxID=2654513 RepID=UPI0012E72BC9|nr:AAA family ATPase [Lentibacillus sp. JNUCC-1]MUV37075.1 5-methylcytosine-specific restriction enzyme [Lentibacillus sp. JNUCC-1]
MDHNCIFYGPPGTGKTHAATREAVHVVANQPADQDHRHLYEQFLESGHIQLCTFHQSLSYEEFIEGIRIGEDGQFKTEDGMFKRISQQAEAAYNAYQHRRFIQMSLGTTGDTYLEYGLEHNMVSTNICTIDSDKMAEETYQQEHQTYDTPEKLAAISKDHWEGSAPYLHIFKNVIKPGDIIFISDHDNKDTVHAIAKVVGDYEYQSEKFNEHYKHMRKVEWLWTDPINVSDIYKADQFDYQIKQLSELKREDFKPAHHVIQLIDPLEKYVLIIDEINRGNIAQIFGELITLIEPNKRLGTKEATTVTLPYSNKPFGVPENLYMIGTMNTADRSIALMDTALRRRFTFKEVMPQSDLLKDIPMENGRGPIRLPKILDTINQRIEFLYDREHTIGHAYLMDCHSVDDVLNAFTKRIIPLLQEYFYGDWRQIEHILGGATQDETDKSYFLFKQEITPATIFNDTVQGELQPKVMYERVEKPEAEALFRIGKWSSK